MIEELHFFYDQGIVGHYEIVLKKSGYSLNALRTSIQEDSFYGSDARCMGQADRFSFSSKVDIVLASLNECHSNDDATTLLSIAIALLSIFIAGDFITDKPGVFSGNSVVAAVGAVCAAILITFIVHRAFCIVERNRLAQSLNILKYEAGRSADSHSR